MTARHRVSKMLLRHGRVYPKASAWTLEHRRWLGRQQFTEPASELVFADLVAAVDGLSARKAQIALRLSELALDERWWSTVARLRAFRGIDTLTALSIHLELGGDWKRFERVTLAALVDGAHAVAKPVRGELAAGLDHQDGLGAGPPAVGGVRLALHANPEHRGAAAAPPKRPARPHSGDQQPRPAAALPRPHQDARPRQARQRPCGRVCPRADLLPLGGPPPRTDPRSQLHPGRWPGAPGPQAAGTRDSTMSNRLPVSSRGRSRSLLDSARRQHERRPWGTQPPHHQTGNAETELPASRPTDQRFRGPIKCSAPPISPAHLTNRPPYQLRPVGRGGRSLSQFGERAVGERVGLGERPRERVAGGPLDP